MFIVVFPHIGLIPLFGYSIPILIIVWLYLKKYDEKFSDIGFSFKSFRLKSLVVSSIAAVLIVSFMQLVFFPILEQFMTFEDTDVELYDFITKNKWNYIFMVLMGWLIGGVYEEIVFHGFIFTRLEKMLSGNYSTALSFIITSLLFGVYHWQLGPLGAINAFFVGALYQTLFLYFKRNLWYSIVCHGVYNSIVISLIYSGYLE